MRPERRKREELLQSLRVASTNLSVCYGGGGTDPEVSNGWALKAVEVQLNEAQQDLADREYVGGAARLAMLLVAIERLRRRGMTRSEHARELEGRAAEVKAAGAAFAADAAAVADFSAGFHELLAVGCARASRGSQEAWKDDLAFFGAFTDRALHGAFGAGAPKVIAVADKAFSQTYTRREGLRREAAARYLSHRPPPKFDLGPTKQSPFELLLVLPYLAVPLGVLLLATSIFPGGWGLGFGVPLALVAFFVAGTLYTPQLIILLLFAALLWGVVKAVLAFL